MAQIRLCVSYTTGGKVIYSILTGEQHLREFRFWRDLGFVLRGIGIGFIADLFALFTSIQIAAFIGMASGIVIIFLMKATKKKY